MCPNTILITHSYIWVKFKKFYKSPTQNKKLLINLFFQKIKNILFNL